MSLSTTDQQVRKWRMEVEAKRKAKTCAEVWAARKAAMAEEREQSNEASLLAQIAASLPAQGI